MSMSENDLELLETYLDGELPDEHCAALRTRIERDPELSAALDELREQRELRQQAYSSIEAAAAGPGCATAWQVEQALRMAITRDLVWSSRLKILRQVSAAAACVVVGLMIGWFARGGVGINRTTSVVAQPAKSPTIAQGSNGMLVSDEHGPAQRRATGGFNVQLTDDAGRVLATQHFDTLNEAREFSNDLFRWQTRQRQFRNGEIRLIGDDF